MTRLMWSGDGRPVFLWNGSMWSRCPPQDQTGTSLWRRFAGVIGIDPDAATDFEVAGNDALGLAECEVLRRVNVALPEDFPRWHHTGLARDVLATAVLSPRSASGRPQVPPKMQKRVLQQTGRTSWASPSPAAQSLVTWQIWKSPTSFRSPNQTLPTTS